MHTAKIYTVSRVHFSEEPVGDEIAVQVPFGDQHYTRYESGLVEIPLGDWYMVIESFDPKQQLEHPLELSILEEGDEQPKDSAAFVMPGGTVVAIRATEDDREGEETE